MLLWHMCHDCSGANVPYGMICGGVCGEGTFDDPHLSVSVEKGTA